MRRVAWTRQAFDEFVSEGMLSKDEIFVLETRIKGWTITKQAQELCMSTDNVNKIIYRLKNKYDYIQKYDPLLPPRKYSAREKYMDTH